MSTQNHWRWAALLATALAASGYSAQPEYPVRPLRVVVPQSPGGANDLTARMLAPLLSERLGQNLVVDNRPGAGSLVGTDTVARAAPDGYTLLVTPSSITIIPSMYQSVPFDPVKDFAAITTLSSYPNLVVVHPSVPANSIKELIALAKAKAGALNFGSGGTGTPTQLGAELFKSMAGINMVHVPYKGGGPAVAALTAAQVDLYFGPIATVLALVKAGKLKALAVTSAQRSAAAPDAPTVSESGVPGFEQITWIGLLAPAQTRAAVVRRLYSEVVAVLSLPAIRERFAAEGVEAGGIPSDDFAAMIKSEIAKWAKVIKQAGIKPE